MKILFLPFSILGGILAGTIAKKLFEAVWGLIEGQAPPEPKHREVRWPRLIAALLIEGAIFRGVKGAVDHGSRQAFSSLTGSWPGKEHPKGT